MLAYQWDLDTGKWDLEKNGDWKMGLVTPPSGPCVQKKRDARAELLFLSLIIFLTFSLPSPSSMLKLPNSSPKTGRFNIFCEEAFISIALHLEIPTE